MGGVAQVGLLEMIDLEPEKYCPNGEGSSPWKNEFGFPSPITGKSYDGSCSFFGG